MSIEKLYIIGNGFDLHHVLDTSYRSFGLFLKEKYPNIYDQLIDYYGFSDLNRCIESSSNDSLWWEFEKSLSLLDSETVFDAHGDSLARPGSQDFRDRDWGAFAIDIEIVVDNLTIELFKAFKEFILKVEYLPLSADLKVAIDNNAIFLTFNYTDTLEQYYDVLEDNINYIHGKAKNTGSELILGHAIDPDRFKPKEQSPPKNLSSVDLEMWMEQMADSYDHSFDLGEQKLHNYFLRTFKETESIITSNSNFFKNLKAVKEVYVLGHSLSDIDMPYFEKIIQVIEDDPVFTVSYYSKENIVSHKKALQHLGVKETNINLKKINKF